MFAQAGFSSTLIKNLHVVGEWQATHTKGQENESIRDSSNNNFGNSIDLDTTSPGSGSRC
jgi:hypothetical protein